MCRATERPIAAVRVRRTAPRRDHAHRRRHGVGVLQRLRRQQKQMQIELRGPDANTLRRSPSRWPAAVAAVPDAVDVGLSTSGQKPELNVRVDRGIAGSIGVTVGQIAQALRPAFAGIDAGDWIDPDGETRDVMVRFAPEARRRAGDIRRCPSCSPCRRRTGRRRSCRSDRWRTSTHGSGPAQIDHLDRQTRRDRVERQRSGPAARATWAATSGQQLRPDAHAARLQGGPGRRDRGAAGGVRADPRAARLRGPPHVPHPGDPVRLVPRSRSRSCVAAAVADRRGARAAR